MATLEKCMLSDDVHEQATADDAGRNRERHIYSAAPHTSGIVARNDVGSLGTVGRPIDMTALSDGHSTSCESEGPEDKPLDSIAASQEEDKMELDGSSCQDPYFTPAETGYSGQNCGFVEIPAASVDIIQRLTGWSPNHGPLKKRASTCDVTPGPNASLRAKTLGLRARTLFCGGNVGTEYANDSVSVREIEEEDDFEDSLASNVRPATQWLVVRSEKRTREARELAKFMEHTICTEYASLEPGAKAREDSVKKTASHPPNVDDGQQHVVERKGPQPVINLIRPTPAAPLDEAECHERIDSPMLDSHEGDLYSDSIRPLTAANLKLVPEAEKLKTPWERDNDETLATIRVLQKQLETMRKCLSDEKMIEGGRNF